jgi:hypothetical protein
VQAARRAGALPADAAVSAGPIEATVATVATEGTETTSLFGRRVTARAAVTAISARCTATSADAAARRAFDGGGAATTRTAMAALSGAASASTVAAHTTVGVAG